MSEPTTQRRVPEILAPAGGVAQFFAALNSGADAVYLGLKEFNARARADNFTIDDLAALVPLAHRHGMKVLVTLNIVIKEHELATLIERLVHLAVVGVDGIIVQDLGLVRLVQQYVPELRLHGSTQMAVHNAAGVRQLHAWGFKRVVLARELSAVELRSIRQVCERHAIEIETFCHGSLCYSYSGLCFFSGANDARSGNRGECAYTCRKPYKILNEPGQGFLFSMRDLYTADHLQLFVDAGVDVLKIEGRKKDAQYVASSVQLYRQRLDALFGYKTGRQPITPLDAEQIETDLKFGFQRQTTSFFLRNRYHENVIDLNSPTHEGVCVGAVTGVKPGRNPNSFRLAITLNDKLEVHDGIRIVADERRFHASPQHGTTINTNSGRALNRSFNNEMAQFAVESIYPSGSQKRVFMAAAKDHIEIETSVGTGAKDIGPGDLVYKLRSADLKRRTDALTKPSERIRPELTVDLKIDFDSENSDVLLVSAKVANMQLPQFHLNVDELAIQGHASQLHDVPKLWSVIGPKPEDVDQRFIVARQIQGEALQWIAELSSKFLKTLKLKLREILLKHIDDYVNGRIDLAVLAMSAELKGVVRSKKVETRIAIKFDQLQYLDYLRTYGVTRLQDQGVCELVFEPKRHLLGFTEVAAGISEWLSFTSECRAVARLAIPVVVRAWDEPYLKSVVKQAYDAGVRAFEIANVGAFRLLRSMLNVDDETLDISTDFSCYALNHQSSLFLAEQGVAKVCLSLEDDLQNIEAHLSRWRPQHVKPQMLLYKDTPLFIAEACSLTALHNGCPSAKVCGYRTLHIENDAGERFYVAHESCKSIVYGEKPASFSQYMDRFINLGIEDFRIDFLTRPYSKSELLQVLEDIIAKRTLKATHSVNMSGQLL